MADKGGKKLFKGILRENQIENHLKSIAPECTIDFEKLFKDKRAKYFRHYMPANITSHEHSYKKNHELFINGNFIKVYISERWN